MERVWKTARKQSMEKWRETDPGNGARKQLENGARKRSQKLIQQTQRKPS
jgi:hypothetical protein